MSCFCRESFAALSQAAALAPRAKPVQPQEEDEEEVPGQATAQELDDWVVQRNRLAPPWKPEPEWVEVPLPVLPPGFAVSIAALMSTYTTLTKVVGVDPTQPEGQTALARMVATLDQRLEEQEQEKPEDLEKYEKLAQASAAAQRIQQAAVAGAFTPEDDEDEEDPGGVPQEEWKPFVASMRQLAPLLKFTVNLQIEDILRVTEVLRGTKLPPMLPGRLLRAAQLARGVSALAQLRDATGIDPTQTEYEQVREAVADRLQDAARAYRKSGAPRDPKALPDLPFRPDFTPDLVQAAVRITSLRVQRLQRSDFLRTAVPVTALAASMQRAFRRGPSPRPCGQQCDARQALAARPPVDLTAPPRPRPLRPGSRLTDGRRVSSEV